jgi:putative oxygen-independent coproporphyrinogen III oxidase
MISIYIHWPFCLSKCPYCDFNSHVANTFDYEVWKNAYAREIDHFSPQIKGKVIRSIFFGGGTPSLMSPDLVYCVINKIATLGVVDSNTEISLEANPNSVESKKFQLFANCGINRISIGVQSLNDKTLKFLGRKHSSNDAIGAIEIAKNCFHNVSCDLIYACHGQDIQTWSIELEQILDFKLNHLSLYQLTIEEETKFHTLVKLGKLPLISSDRSLELYEYTNFTLLKAGYKRYEISNYALNDAFRCKHNINYWNYEDYIGIGPGAHSRIMSNEEVIAIEMHKSPQIWMKQVNEKSNGIFVKNKLTKQEAITEALFMGLRVPWGVCLKKLESIAQKSLSSCFSEQNFQFLVENEFLWRSKDKIALTNKGMLLHTEITSQLTDIFTQN